MKNLKKGLDFLTLILNYYSSFNEGDHIIVTIVIVVDVAAAVEILLQVYFNILAFNNGKETLKFIITTVTFLMILLIACFLGNLIFNIIIFRPKKT